ncbi:hypothetical protein [Caproiciproducens sp. CPB-2]|uniref:hypothetical protein n=1 Tax=Caproiciproducens sp. CPB-2 TaxID=3030017 RepID=UPI0023DA5F34|nr:hypothetical protein [Caproiciproducens sp. CPB-2]MDF1496325.1 hypothetical protein [Caproiciproducens sp. CPB-2]
MKTEQPNVELIAEDEIFKTVRIYDEYYQNYLVSNYGRVYSKNVNRFLYQGIDNHGYTRFKIYKNGKEKKISGQRLVAFAFVKNPQPDKFNTVNHKNEIKTDNFYLNLEWTDDRGNLNWATCQKRRSTQRAKKVLQFDLNNNLIAEYDSLPDIKKKLGYNGSVICNRIKSGEPYQGYYWRHTS